MRTHRILAFLICMTMIGFYPVARVKATNETAIAVDTVTAMGGGDILNGNIAPISVTLKNGGITVDGNSQEVSPALTVDQTIAQPGTSVSVPIRISGNTGICGATLSVEYDENLVLTNIEKGTALAGLTLTKPGNLSANPVNLVWDGLEPDTTNGIAAVLTFAAPNRNGAYRIAVSYDEGDILDGNLLPVTMETNQGGITVMTPNDTVVEVGGMGITIPTREHMGAAILVAFYNNTGGVVEVQSYLAAGGKITINNYDSSAAQVKVMLWDAASSLKPICGFKRIDITR